MQVRMVKKKRHFQQKLIIYFSVAILDGQVRIVISAKSLQDVSTAIVPNLWNVFVIKVTAARFVIALFAVMDVIKLQVCTSFPSL